MKKLISLALALIVMLACLPFAAAAVEQPDVGQMIEYHHSPCSLTVPGLPQYIKGAFDYDETKCAILYEHPDYEGRGFVFPAAGERYGALYDLNWQINGTVITYEYTLKDGKTIDDYYDAMDADREAHELEPISRNGKVSLTTIDVALRVIPDLYGTPGVMLIKPEILEVTTVDGEVLYRDGERTGTGYGYQALAMPLPFDGDKVDVPAIVYARGFDGGVILRWKQAENADHYAVYRKDKGEWVYIDDAPYGYYIDTDADPDGVYIYTVRGVDADGNAFADWDQVGYTYRKDAYGDQSSAVVVDTPQITSFEDTADGVRVSWGTVWGTWKYRLYYKSANGWTRIAETDKTSFVDKAVKWGTSYTYTVRCINEAGDFISGFESKGWTHTHYLNTPQITKFSNSTSGVNIQWSAVPYAAKYRVYYYGKKGWTRMATVAGTSYLDKDVSAGTTYRYTVRCVNDADNTFTSDCSGAGWKHTYYPCDVPQITSFESTASGVKINWSRPNGAEQFAVYYKGRNGWTRMGTTTGTSYLDKDVKVGSAYRYTVRCLNTAGNKFTSDYNGDGWTYTFSPVLDTPHIKSYENLTDGVKITWGAVEGAVRYRVYYQIVDFNTGWKRAGEATGTALYFKPRDFEKEADLPSIYTVRCITADGKGFCSDFDRDNAPHTFYDPPTVGAETTRAGIKITWSWQHDATYRVYYKGRNGWTRMADVKGGQYLDTDIKPMGTYTYTVRRISNDGKQFLSYYDTAGVRHTYNTNQFIPEIKHLLLYEDKLLFYTGEPIYGITKYRLFLKNGSSWSRYADVEIDYDTYLDYENADEFYSTTNFIPGKTYTFTLRGMDDKGNYITDFYRDGFTIATLPIVGLDDIAYDREKDTLTVSWTPVSGAAGYMVYMVPRHFGENYEPVYVNSSSYTVRTNYHAGMIWDVYFGPYNDDGAMGTVLHYEFFPENYEV